MFFVGNDAIKALSFGDQIIIHFFWRCCGCCVPTQLVYLLSDVVGAVFCVSTQLVYLLSMCIVRASLKFELCWNAFELGFK
jgi:hypothetical protein